MPDRMAKPGEGSDIFAPMPDEHIARLTQIEATRHLAQTIERMERTVNNLTGEVSQLRTDIAIMKLQDEKISELKDLTAKITSDILSIQMKQVRMEGAGVGLRTVREWAPSVLCLLIALVMLTKEGVLHL